MKFSSPIPALAFVMTFHMIWQPFGGLSRLTISRAKAGEQSKRRLSFASCLKLKHLRGILRLWSTGRTNNVAMVTTRISRETHGRFWGGFSSCCSGVIMLSVMFMISAHIYNNPSQPWGWAAAVALWWTIGFAGNGGTNVVEIDIKIVTLKYLNFIPGRLISRYWGRAMNKFKVHRLLRPYLFAAYVWLFKVKLYECQIRDLQHYDYISKFFLRSLLKQYRPINHIVNVVSPCDGKILSCGKVTGDVIRNVKGLTYNLRSFLGPDFGSKTDGLRGKQCSDFSQQLLQNPGSNDLFQCVIYLAPGDYHKFHSPVNWKVNFRRHFPGDLLSVHPLVASLVPNLYVLNERVSMFGEWKFGFFSMTAVGATNVGSINIYCDDGLITNQGEYVHGEHRDRYFLDNNTKGFRYENGEMFGEFNLGSTIVLVFEAPKSFKFKTNENERVEFGSEI